MYKEFPLGYLPSGLQPSGRMIEWRLHCRAGVGFVVAAKQRQLSVDIVKPCDGAVVRVNTGHVVLRTTALHRDSLKMSKNTKSYIIDVT